MCVCVCVRLDDDDDDFDSEDQSDHKSAKEVRRHSAGSTPECVLCRHAYTDAVVHPTSRAHVPVSPAHACVRVWLK